MPLEIPGKPLNSLDREFLRKHIYERFNIEELKYLCFNLGLDFEDLPGQSTSAIALSLVSHFERTGRLEELIQYLKKERPASDWSIFNAPQPRSEIPFKGLDYFSEADASLFFGRETLVEELIDKIKQSNFLAIVGASGSGKTSIVHAGLIPALRKETNWLIYYTRPGNRPLLFLANTLTQDAESVKAATVLMDDMATDDRSLDIYLRRLFFQPVRPVSNKINPEYRRYLTDLIEKLLKLFDQQELQLIAYHLEADYVYEAARTRSANVLELITFLERRDQINRLIAVVSELRPKVRWSYPPERTTETSTELQAGTPQPSRLLLVVDQFEELFLYHDEKERQAFINNLLNAAQANGPTTVVIVLRADFYARAVEHNGLRRVLAQNQVTIGLMTREELWQVIERPAEAAGLSFEPGLVERILDDMGTEPGGVLPLLQYVLHEIWQQRDGQTLTHAGYKATGGIRGALVQSAENVYQTLTSEERLWARQIFLRLIEVNEGNIETRRQASKNELLMSSGSNIGVESVLAKLSDARLIIVDLGNVEIAHEALIQKWPRLREWLDESRESLRIHHQLSQDARQWLKAGRDGSLLYRGARLAQVQEWTEANSANLNELERQFIAASEQAAKSRSPFLPTITWDGCTVALKRSGFFLAGVIIVSILIVMALGSANRTTQTLPFLVLGLLIAIYLANRNWHNITASFQNWSSTRTQHGRYTEQWEACTPLQKLVLLLAPANTSFSAEDLESEFSILGAGSDAGSIQLALSSLTRLELAIEERGKWRIAHHKLLVKHRHKQQAILTSLVTQTREDSPFFKRAFEFLQRAGLVMQPIPHKPVYLCHAAVSLPPALNHQLSFPVCLSFFIGTKMNDAQILKIRDWAREIDAGTNTVLLLTNCRLTDSAWGQIGVLRLSSFHILPIDHVAIDEGLAKKRESQVLAAEVEKWLGRNFDPYDVRAPVAGAFSFFGREAQMTQFLRNLENGTSFGIFGLRKMGKTSLLQTLRDRAPYPIALVNAQTVSSRGLTALYQRSFEYWAQWIKVHHHKEWRPPKIARDESPGTFATKIIGLFDWLKREGLDARLGLFLDEAELIVPEPEETGEKLQLYLGLVRALRGLIDEDHSLTLVVASLNPSITRINNWGREQNPTYSLFKENSLLPLTRDDCIQMVENIGSQVGLVYDADCLQAIADLSGGHPFLARQLCSVLFSLRNRELGQIERSEIDIAAHHFIYSDQTVPYLDAGIWQDAGNTHLWSSPEQAQENQNVLLELARADGLVSTEHLLSPNPTIRRESLIGLTNYGIIHDPEPGLYTIKFGLLRQWLRHRKLGLG